MLKNSFERFKQRAKEAPAQVKASLIAALPWIATLAGCILFSVAYLLFAIWLATTVN